jgi:SSS family solute:Na+ symporter
MVGLPPALGTLALAAVFSAEMSSADAILFMLSTSLSKDLYKRFLRPDASDGQVLTVARWAAIAGGGLSLILALTLTTVIESLTIFYAVLGVILTVPLVAGLYSRRPGVPEALAAVGVGLSALAVAHLGSWDEIHVLLNPTLVGIGLSAGAFLLVLIVRRLRESRTGTSV